MLLDFLGPVLKNLPANAGNTIPEVGLAGPFLHVTQDEPGDAHIGERVGVSNADITALILPSAPSFKREENRCRSQT